MRRSSEKSIAFDTSIPVKPYVRRYLENCFGTPVLMRRNSDIGKYFYQLLDDPKEEMDKRYSEYKELVTIRITERVFLHKGCVLTRNNIIEFNNFVEEHLKTQLRIVIDTLVELKEIEIREAILYAYDKFNQDETVLPLETIKKDYYRYRKRRKAS